MYAILLVIKNCIFFQSFAKNDSAQRVSLCGDGTCYGMYMYMSLSCSDYSRTELKSCCKLIYFVKPLQNLCKTFEGVCICIFKKALQSFENFFCTKLL